MRLLLDTHVILWWYDANAAVSAELRKSINSSSTESFASAVSAWEIAVKQASGKLQAPDRIEELLAAGRFHALPITARHAFVSATLPPIHRDPFDRLLVAQALVEGLTLVTRDKELARYGIQILRA